MKLSGVHSPIVTPFTADGKIDFNTLEAVIEFQLQCGVTGILPGGSTGEFYAMTPTERHDLNSFVKDAVGNRAVLIAGANATTTQDVIGYCRDAEKLGYEAVMLAPPYYSLPAQDEVLKHFQMVLDAMGLPLVLYNFPARAGVEVGYDVLDGLADHPQVIAIKESSGDLSRIPGILERYAGRIQLVCGADDQAYDYFAKGVDAWIAGGANSAPAEHVAVLEAAVAGDLPKSRAAMDKLLPFIENIEGGKYVQKVKYAMELAGVPCGATRAPMMALNDSEKSSVQADFNAMKP
ncbi:MAG: dihydrodipicolinate synthase family protein [Rhodospirillales bacterium]|jgi:4-hydroxy-tetrahydrodipicolinate synthase|nr:dihydrodipicolinate synthase family protein [Rhodospirillales bacterium]